MKFIAIRKEPDGKKYISANFFDRFTDADLGKYGFIKFEAPSDCKLTDFNDDLSFNIDKYNTRKRKDLQIEYESLVVEKIRERYNLNQELAILRQRDSKPEEFYEYNTYVEMCKQEIKTKYNL